MSRITSRLQASRATRRRRALNRALISCAPAVRNELLDMLDSGHPAL